jgi:RNA polymerase sigma-70 factor (ECF subfamily)
MTDLLMGDLPTYADDPDQTESAQSDPLSMPTHQNLAPIAVPDVTDVAEVVGVADIADVVDPVPATGSVDVSELHVMVAAAVDGDRSAIDRLMFHIRPLVVRYCRARVGRQERLYGSADDVAQEVLLAVFTSLKAYRDQGRPFLAFVYGIASHKVADAHRAAGRNRADPVAEVPDGPESEAGPELRVMRGEQSDQMAALLRLLPPKQREILALRVVVGLSAEETAEAVGSTPGAVRVAQHRALNKLRAELANGNGRTF